MMVIGRGLGDRFVDGVIVVILCGIASLSLFPRASLWRLIGL